MGQPGGEVTHKTVRKDNCSSTCQCGQEPSDNPMNMKDLNVRVVALRDSAC